MSDIPPNFGYREFDNESLALDFLAEYKFQVISRRSDYDIYETKTSKIVRANLYQKEDGKWVVAQQIEK